MCPPDARLSHRSFPAVQSESHAPVARWEDYRLLVETSDDLLTVVDGVGCILYDNPVVQSALGYRQGELVGRNAFELIHPQDYPVAVALLTEMISGERSAGTLAFRFRRSDGRWSWLRSSGRVARTATGSCVVVTSHVVPAGSDPGAEESKTSSWEELDGARVEVVERLARAAEFRDDDTGHHLRRVGGRSAALARQLGLTAVEVEIVRRASPLHDVGKIGIPDSILLKPGPLLPAEEAVMRTHPVLGARILEGGESALVRAAEVIALFHHERWDGAGYPQGLAGEAIPLPARIVALVDFYDALTHDRPYRRAWQRERVIELIREETGARFDPALAAAFLALLREEPGGRH